MKLTFTKEVELKEAHININIDLKKELSTIALRYTCSDCGGYGCRKDNGCVNGAIEIDLDPTKIDKILDAETASKLRSIIQKLSSSITKHQPSASSIIPFL